MFGIFKKRDINEGVKNAKADEKAVILDVRGSDEYASGHIPGAVNIPLRELGFVEDFIPDKSAPVYVYCLSGGRSRQAAAVLEQMGYEKVDDIGGIEKYNGEIEK